MSEKRQTQIVSCILAMSLLLSFWVCVEGCEAFESDCESQSSTLQNARADDAHEESCSVQTTPTAVFSKQQFSAPAELSAPPRRPPIQTFVVIFAPIVSDQNARSHARLPLQILPQLRI